MLDLQEFTWSRIQVTSKQQPVARSGHAATLVNNLLVIFGGRSRLGGARRAGASGARGAAVAHHWPGCATSSLELHSRIFAAALLPATLDQLC